jgi:hypothetical protein
MKTAISPASSVRTLRNQGKPVRQSEEVVTLLENSIYQSLSVEGYEVDRELLRTRSRAVLEASSKTEQLEKTH